MELGKAGACYQLNLLCSRALPWYGCYSEDLLAFSLRLRLRHFLKAASLLPAISVIADGSHLTRTLNEALKLDLDFDFHLDSANPAAANLIYQSLGRKVKAQQQQSQGQ
jgi:hypothetical protein